MRILKVSLLLLVFVCSLHAADVGTVNYKKNTIRVDLVPSAIMLAVSYGSTPSLSLPSIEYSRRISDVLAVQVMAMGLSYFTEHIWCIGGGIDITPFAKERPNGLILSLAGGVGVISSGGILCAARADVGYQAVSASGFTFIATGGVLLSLSFLPIVPIIKLGFGYTF